MGETIKFTTLSFEDLQTQGVGLFKTIVSAAEPSRSASIKNLTVASTDPTFNTNSGIFAAAITGTEEKPIALTNIKMAAAGTFFCLQHCALLVGEASYVDVSDITFTTASPVFIVRGDKETYAAYSNYVGFIFAKLQDSTVSKVTTDIEFTAAKASNRGTKNCAILAAQALRSTLEKMHFSFEATVDLGMLHAAVIASYALDTTI